MALSKSKELEKFMMNIKLLEYRPSSRDFFTEIKLFETSQMNIVEHVLHFLFQTLDPLKAKTFFGNCYPCANLQRSQKFRTACINWWKTLITENPSLNLPRLTGMMLKDARGETIIHFLFMFSYFVLQQICEKMSEKFSVLQPPVKCEAVLLRIQTTALKAAGISEYKQFLKNIQILKHENKILQEFADKNVKLYHESDKRIKLLRLKRDKLMKNSFVKKIMTPSKRNDKYASFSNRDYENSRKLFNKPLAVNRKINEKIEISLQEMQSGQAIISFILEQNRGRKVVLKANELDVRVPALLAKDHTNAVYEKIGSSLYTKGLLNIQSLSSLFNLSLCVLLEKFHSGIPNFEGDLSKVIAQLHMQAKNCQVLLKIKTDLEIQRPKIQNEILQRKLRLDDRRKTEIDLTNKQQNNVFLTPQKFPWSQADALTFTPQESDDLNLVPVLSLGLHSNVMALPSPIKNLNSHSRKKLEYQHTQHVRTLNTQSKTPKEISKTDKPCPKNPFTQIAPPSLSYSTEEEKHENENQKVKTVSERALSNLAGNIVSSVVEATPSKPQLSPQLDQLVTPMEVNPAFNLSTEITTSGGFKAQPLLKYTPTDCFNDSVFERKEVNNSNLLRDDFGDSPILYRGENETFASNTFKNATDTPDGVKPVETKDQIIETPKLISQRKKVSEVDVISPLSTISINSKYLRTMSQVLSSTDESEIEKTPFHVWKCAPNAPVFDFLNDVMEAPEFLCSSDEEADATAIENEENISQSTVSANLIDLSHPSSDTPLVPPTVDDKENQSFDLIDFSTF